MQDVLLGGGAGIMLAAAVFSLLLPSLEKASELVGRGAPSVALVGAASGAVEPLAGLAGAILVGLSAAALPFALALCAGAMLFVISHEIIPESHRQGHETPATFGLLVGFIAMMFLDVALS